MILMIRNNRQGLTLVELMIVMVLSIVLMGAVYVAYQAQYKTGRLQEHVATMQQDLRAGFMIMEKDIRNAGCDPTFLNITPLLAGTTGLHALAVQWDSSGVGTHVEKIIYHIDGTNLLRNDDVILQNVTSFGISYWDVDGNQSPLSGTVNATYNSGKTLASSDEPDVRSVQVNMTLRSKKRDVETDSFLYRNFSRRIRLRNIE